MTFAYSQRKYSHFRLGAGRSLSASRSFGPIAPFPSHYLLHPFVIPSTLPSLPFFYSVTAMDDLLYPRVVPSLATGTTSCDGGHGRMLQIQEVQHRQVVRCLGRASRRCQRGRRELRPSVRGMLQPAMTELGTAGPVCCNQQWGCILQPSAQDA